MVDAMKEFFNGIREEFRSPPSKTSIKIALVGDGATGKTSFFNRIASGTCVDYKFSKVYDATHGCNICQIEYMIGIYPITVHLFDTAGQEKFGMLRESYLSGADAIIVMYDLSEKTTKHNVMTKWIPEIRKILTSTQYSKYVPIAVIGNKNEKDEIDLSGFRTATLVGAYDPCKFGPIDHFNISVKADDNLMKPINWILKHILAYIMTVEVRRSEKKPVIYLCNK
jgi:GTP-binding nuclear protein Ran